MFPGKVVLNVDDIASLTDYSKGHIYNLASANRLPFKVGNELGDRILVSIIELSDYLDLTLLSKPSTQAQGGSGRALEEMERLYTVFTND